jgi:4-hydroxy-tetrahydrodipicolinate synthase
MKPITKDQLCGMWAALPLPWQENGSLDDEIYEGDIARCCASRVNGVYSGGTTGEFYAQDFALFSQVNRILVQTAHEHGTPVQAGCTALGTEEACQRVRFAREIGADIIQIALPFWLELDDEEVVEFFKAVATAAGDVPLVHYDTGRAKRRISPGLYQRLGREVPTLWGTKFGGADIHAVKQITLANPDLKVFVGEHILASATPMGATGSYSALVLLNPGWMMEYFEACRDRQWNHAFEVQDEIGRLFSTLGSLPTPGLQDSALDRLFGQLDNFLQCPIACKPPYRSGTVSDLEYLRNWTEKNLPHLLQKAVV